MFLKHVATDTGRKTVPQMERNHRGAEVGGVAPGGAVVSGSEAEVALCAHRQAPVLTEE